MLCLLAAALAWACGKKGDPEPPIRLLPAPTTELSVLQRGRELLLELPYPRTTAAGTPLPRISELAVWELVWRAPEGAPPAPQVDERQFEAGARPVRRIAADELREVVRGDRIVLAVAVPEPPAEGPGRPVVTVAVRTAGPGGEQSALSNRVSFPLIDPPEPPAGLEAEGVPAGVRVRWRYAADDAPAGEAEEAGEPAEAGEAAGPGEAAEPGLAGFNVYRRLATERSYGAALRPVGRRARAFLDESARFGERYIYTVTAVASRRPVVVESGLAEEVEVDYRDRFAPPAPRGLVALTEPGRVRLLWEASPAPDLAGYRLYRRSPDTQEFELLAEGLLTATEHVDLDLAPGATYSYRVTAVDELGNESAPSETATAAVR